MSILHMSHIHPLTLKVRDPSDTEYDNVCLICLQKLDCDLIYNCRRCYFPVHKYCAEFPTEINHLFHPHSLILIDHHVSDRQSSGWYKFVCSKSTLCRLMKNGQYEEMKKFLESTYVLPCSACGGMNRYSLRPNILPPIPASGECQFNLDLKCAALMLVPDNFRMPAAVTMQHEHRLLACTNKLNEYHYSCFRCGEDCDEDDYIYVCLECKCLLHQCCAALPRQIKHPLHLHHALNLRVDEETEPFFCNVCSLNNLRTERIFYGCSMCDFNVDIWCAKLELDQRKQINQEPSYSHPHQCHRHHSLIQCASLKDFPRLCFACGQSFDDEDSIFVCLQCSILLHTSCIDPPTEILHLFHPQHALQFCPCSDSSSRWHNGSNCNRCGYRYAKYLYACDDCKFCLDIRCARTKPEIDSSEIHEHPLAFCRFQGSFDISCSYCQHYFQYDFALRCCLSECHYSIRPRCLPSLPETFKHDCHIHPLTLSRSRVKELPDEVRDEDAKFYCYACEEERDLDDPCYHCTSEEDCIFIAHVHCLICKIVSCMQTRPSNVVSEQSAASSVLLVEVPDSTAEGTKDGNPKIEKSLTGNAGHVVMEGNASNKVATEEARDSITNVSMDLSLKLGTPLNENTENEATSESASPAVATTAEAQASISEPNVQDLDQEIAAAEHELVAWTREINQLREKRQQILASSAK